METKIRDFVEITELRGQRARWVICMLQAEGRQKRAMVSSGCGKGGASKYVGKSNIMNGLVGS